MTSLPTNALFATPETTPDWVPNIGSSLLGHVFISTEARLNVPIEKLRRLCKAIVEEDDPETLTRLIAELTEHLQQDQNAIKAKISQFKGLARH